MLCLKSSKSAIAQIISYRKKNINVKTIHSVSLPLYFFYIFIIVFLFVKLANMFHIAAYYLTKRNNKPLKRKY